jgi:hypothetical protein
MDNGAGTSRPPRAYWDRATRMVRAWNTDHALPHYEGECLVYLDIRGPVFVKTFLCDGERCWDELN